MKIKFLSSLLVTVLFLTTTSAKKTFVSIERYKCAEFSEDFQIGIRTSDSTAQLNISNADIQTHVISKITALINCTITNDISRIIIGKDVSYLVFKVNSTEGVVSIAVQVSAEGPVIKYRNVEGLQLHKCKSASSCGCSFIVNKNKNIIGCGCNQQVLTDSCKHIFFSTK